MGPVYTVSRSFCKATDTVVKAVASMASNRLEIPAYKVEQVAYLVQSSHPWNGVLSAEASQRWCVNCRLGKLMDGRCSGWRLAHDRGTARDSFGGCSHLTRFSIFLFGHCLLF